MYFSKHNENITYINHYSGLLEVKGKGVLSLEDTELLYDQGKLSGQLRRRRIR